MSNHEFSKEFDGNAWREYHGARAKYPDWPTNLVEAFSILSEEVGEVNREVNNYHFKQKGGSSLDEIVGECIQVQAMLWRFLDGIEKLKGEE